MLQAMFVYFEKTWLTASKFSDELTAIVGDDGEMLKVTCCWDGWCIDP
jgi:hypothetical protein